MDLGSQVMHCHAVSRGRLVAWLPRKNIRRSRHCAVCSRTMQNESKSRITFCSRRGESHGSCLNRHALRQAALDAPRGRASLGFAQFEQTVNRIAGKSTALKKPHLLGFFSGARGWRRKFSLPDGAGGFEFLLARGYCELRNTLGVDAFGF